MLPPLVLLAVAMALVIGAIVVLRLNAFLALVGTAVVVSLLSPGEPAEKITRVAEGFGRTAGNIAIIIGLAAIIGQAMMDSGAADRIVTAFVRVLGEKRGAAALGTTGFILSIPVFFDAFATSSLIKIAQDSSTVAMITTAGMLGALVTNAPLPFHAVYVATAIASGSLVGTWMNDSGFWVFSRMGGVTERQTLLSWTPLSAIVGTTAMVTTVLLALLLPLR